MPIFGINKKQISNNNYHSHKSKAPTKGELFIEEYLIESLIKHESQVKIEGLNGDQAKYRVADFYLPRLGYYVEYFGLYNASDKIKNQYNFKREIYFKNGKPTIFIMPEDLGILDYVFHTETRRLFRYKQFHTKWKVFRYSLNRYFLKGKPFALILSIYFYIMGIILTGFDLGINIGLRTIIGYSSYVLAWYCMFKFIVDFLKYVHWKEITGFFRDKTRRN
ncbi:hypothetical protein OO009_04730 [Flavobacteriaceae bacterium KMM 6897]|nr:hypothetical protein [Flavobacteriaceae bacterium KMM 6897]